MQRTTEAQAGPDYALAWTYINRESRNRLDDKYDPIIALLVTMAIHPGKGAYESPPRLSASSPLPGLSQKNFPFHWVFSLSRLS